MNDPLDAVRLPIASDEEFHRLMDELDRQCQARGEQIIGRELRLMQMFCMRFKIQMLWKFTRSHPAEPNVYTLFNFGRHLDTWVTRRYGSKLHLDPACGYFPFVIRGDAWLIEIPLTMGRVKLVIDRDLNKVYPASTINLLHLIDGLTPDLARELTDIEVLTARRMFIIHFELFTGFMKKPLGSQALANIACRDLTTGARRVAKDRRELGVARWDALQAAEKFLKHYIQERGHQFRKTHDVGELAAQAERSGLVGDFDRHVAAVKCDASVRYEDTGTQVPEVVIALQAAASLGHAVAAQT